MPVSDAQFEAVRDRMSAAEQKIAVKAATDEAIEIRLGKIEGNLLWLTRTVLGAIVLALIGFFVKGGFAG